MKNIMIFKEKHGDRVFIANTETDMCDIAFFILHERLQERWYDDETATKAFDIFSSGDRRKALQFLRQRSSQHYEYEEIQMDKAKEASDLDIKF